MHYQTKLPKHQFYDIQPLLKTYGGHFWKIQSATVCEKSVVSLPSQNAKFLEGSVRPAVPAVSLLLATPQW